MSSNTNFTESHQSKADLQRQYREKEGEGFAELQQAIREVTEGQVALAKRHETLTTATQKIRELSRQNEELRRQLMYAPFSTAQYPAQYYPGNAAPSGTNYLGGYPGQGRGV